MKTIKVKEWIANKIDMEAKRYNTWCDVVYEKDCNGYPISYDKDGNVTYIVEEVLKETEKAIQVKLSTGHIDGSTKGWTTWIPKSAIIDLDTTSEIIDEVVDCAVDALIYFVSDNSDVTSLDIELFANDVVRNHLENKNNIDIDSVVERVIREYEAY